MNAQKAKALVVEEVQKLDPKIGNMEDSLLIPAKVIQRLCARTRICLCYDLRTTLKSASAQLVNKA